mgnify:CR=1 FL=1
MDEPLLSVGRSSRRRDIQAKVTGEAKYTADLTLPNMLHARILRSPHPHARIKRVNINGANSHPGVHATVTPYDVPAGKIAPDLPILDSKVRYVGDEVAAVAAEDIFAADEAVQLIDVEYEILSFSTNTDQSLAKGAEPIHGGSNLINGGPIVEQRGNVDDGFREADLIVEESFTTPGHSPAPLEPRAALTSWDGKVLTVWKSSRGIHADRTNIANALGLQESAVRVIGPHMGGGYGGKDETRTAVIAAVLAIKSGRPVRIELSRKEEFLAGRRRHSTKSSVKMGLKLDGTITAIHAVTVMDTGAYLSSGPGVARRAGQGALYLYRCSNVRYDGYIVYTNRPTAGSYRALGAPQGHFALESVVDKAAEALNMNPLEFRLKNHVGIEGQPGERTTPKNIIVDAQPVEGGIRFSSNGLGQCIRLGSKAVGWDGSSNVERNDSVVKYGVGMSIFLYRGGPGGRSRASINVNSNGEYTLFTGVMDVGEGSATVLSQIAAEILRTGSESISLAMGDTDITPTAGLTAGSSVTFSSGLAVQKAAEDLKGRLLYSASAYCGENVNDLRLDERGVISNSNLIIPFEEFIEHGCLVTGSGVVDPGSEDCIINSFGAHFAKVAVDTQTGTVTILKYVAAHDSGRIINPAMAENQVRGGVAQMLGFTFLEDMETDPGTGITLNPSFLEHKSPTILDCPDVEVIFADVVDPIGPFGAKSLGEPPCIAPAPTIANAIYNAVGIRMTDLPITSRRILSAIDMTK